MDVRQRIIDLRTETGISTNRLAKLASIGQSTLSDIEAGNVKPSIDSLEKICLALGISMADFFEDGVDEFSIDVRRLLQTIQSLTPTQRELLDKFLREMKGDAR